MITISKTDNQFIFKVNGMHKLWAFKSELKIPIDHVIGAHQDPESLKGWKGWRAPGTEIPWLITAGTFYKDGEKIFWDVSNRESCIIVNLQDEDYKQLVIEVEDPADALQILNHNS